MFPKGQFTLEIRIAQYTFFPFDETSYGFIITNLTHTTVPSAKQTYYYEPSFPFTYPLTAGVVVATQMTSQPVSSIFSVLHCPLGLCGLQACPFLDVVLLLLFLSHCLLPPFAVPREMVLARPDERETYPYHLSLHLFTMVRRSSRSPIGMFGMSFLLYLVLCPLQKIP